MPKDKRVYEIPSIGDDGRLEVKRKVAVVEDGQIVLKVVD
jgi:branched-chain amino acid transport system substrate-binding protein